MDIGSSVLVKHRFWSFIIIILDLNALIHDCIRKTILSDVTGLLCSISMINIVKISYLSKHVLHLELLKKTNKNCPCPIYCLGQIRREVYREICGSILLRKTRYWKKSKIVF